MKKLENLIIKNTIRDIQIRMLKQEEKGLIINRDIMNEILADVEKDAENQTVGEEETAEEAETKKSDGDETDKEIRDREIEADSIRDAIADNK